MKESAVRNSKTEVRSGTGMVTALHPEAARVGVRIMEQGGNAVDALLASLAVMSVVEPFMSGLGGHGAALLAMNGRPPEVIDGSATAPGLFAAGQAQMRGARSVPVPNAGRAWSAIHERAATWDMPDLLAPAVRLAADGWPAEWYTAMMLASHMELLREFPAAAETFLLAGWRPPRPVLMHGQVAERVPNPEMAATLERFARLGWREMVTGDTAELMVNSVVEAGGFLRETDLHATREVAPQLPQLGVFHGHRVHAGPDTSAASALLQMLLLLEEVDPAAVELGSVDYYECLIRVQEVSRIDREYLGDPEFVDVPLGAYGDRSLTSLRRSDMRLFPGKPVPVRNLSRADYPLAPFRPAGPAVPGTSTTHVNVADAHGNMACATFTLGHPFGSGLSPRGTGILLLNTLHQFSAVAGHPNAPAAGKRAIWNGSPVVLTKDGQPVVIAGAPGGTRIAAAVSQVLFNHIVYGLSPQAAVQVPRIFNSGDVVFIDDRVAPEVVAGLRERGYRLESVQESVSSVNFARPGLISLDRAADQWCGGIDEWRIGMVAGV